MNDPVGAMFRPDVRLEPMMSGPLSGLTFAVKENFDVQGLVTSAGNPDWLRTHEEAVQNAHVIDRLRMAGATLTGKTHTDELMFSLNGENVHYGTPTNPRAEGRVPGGSSSGSAVAVAAGLTDFALGTDTGGSVRIPSSYCGVYGIRPSHGRLSTDGVIKLAPSFCTVGWMAPSADTLALVGDVLFGTRGVTYAPYQRCVVATEGLHLAGTDVSDALLQRVGAIQSRFNRFSIEPISRAGLEAWYFAFRTLQGFEIWHTHGDWITQVSPTFGPGIAERFAWTKTVSADSAQLAIRMKRDIAAELDECLGKHTLLVLPTAPGIAPRIGLDTDALDDWRSQTMQLTCIAGLAGLPQVTIPAMSLDGCPVGLSFIAPRGQDERLLHFVADLSELLVPSH